MFQSNPAPTLDDCGGVKPFPLTRTKDGKFPINPYLQHDPTVSTLELAASAEQRKQLYPLHAAIDKYRKADVETRIKHYYQQDPDSIHEPDDHGVRPIFAAIIRRNVRAVRVLLKLGVGEDLRCRENVFRLAPIEWNARELTFVREWHLRPSSGISWDGSEDQRLEIQWLLKRRRKKKLRAVEQPLAGYVAQRKWGCNCGNCLGGWLSPRMISRIKGMLPVHCYNSFLIIHLNQALKVYKESEITKQRTKMTDIITSFLPLYLKRQGLSRKFYAGYRLVFREIAEFLSNDKLTNYFKSKRPATNETNHASAANAVPALQPRVVSLTLTPSAMEDPSLPFLADALAHFLLPTSARAPSETLVISHYTRTGGKAEYALDCLLMLTQNDSSAEVAATQKQHANVMAGLPVLPGSPRSRSGIKRCVNDYAYELVRQRIGLSKNETWGPYLLKMPQVYNTSKRPLSVDISRASSPITPITGGEKHDLTTEDASSGTTASCNADDVLSQTSVHSPAPDQAFPLDAGARTSITKAAAKKRGMDRTENLATSVTSIAPFPVLSRELGHDNDIFTTEEGRPENLTTSMDGMMENEPSALPSTGLLNRKSKRRLEDEEVAPQVKQRRTTGADGEGSHASPTVTNMPMLGTNASAPNERALTVQEEEAPRSEANTVEPNPTEFVLGVVGTPHRWPCIPVPENIMPKFGCSSLPTPKVSMFSHVFVAKSQPRNDGHI